MNKDDLADALIYYADNPRSFVVDIIGAQPQKWQSDALDLIRDNDRVAIKSGHGVGKTTFLCWLVIWYLCTRVPVKIPITANTASQLSDVLWNDLQKWIRQMHPAFKDQLEITASRIGLLGQPDSFATARTSSKDRPEALQGFHSDNLMFVVDEASGVPDIIFEVGQGALSTPGAKIVMTGNPTRTTGYFFDAFNKNKDRWATMTVSSEDGDYVDETFIDDMAGQYGADSNIYRVRVLGQFPESDDDALIPKHLVEAAVDRDVSVMAGLPVVWGLDVARFGDDRTALAKRRGNVLMEPIKSWQGKDLMQVAGLILAEYDATPYPQRPAEILIDSIGLGAGAVDRLREMDFGPTIRGVNVSESPALGQKYNKLRDELWFRVREWFEARDCKIPFDETLIDELSQPTFEFLSSGKLKVEGKTEMKKRGLRSPDLADAFMLTFASMAARASSAQGYRHQGKLEYQSDWVI